MAFLDHNGESEFPFSKEIVFDTMYKVIPTVKGMKIESTDKLQGRIIVKSGVSLFSWGENIPIQLISVSENRTKVQITSSPKTGIMFGGAFDMGKNRKNIEIILSETSRILSSCITNQIEKSYLMTESYTRTKKNWYDKTWLVGLLCWLFFPVGLYGLWKSERIKIGWKIGVTLLIGFLFVNFIIELGKGNDSAVPETGMKSAEVKLDTISALYYYRVYNSNEVRGDNMFKGKQFYIHGIIGKVTKDMGGNAVVFLNVDYEGLYNVILNLKNVNDAQNLWHNQKVLFKGKGAGKSIGNPYIDDATVEGVYKNKSN